MNYRRSRAWRLAAGLLALGALGLSQGVLARDNVHWSISIGAPVYVQPAPVYVHPAPPVYVQPGPVYLQPGPVYLQPAPVYVQPAPVYLHPTPIFTQPRPVYTPPRVVYSQRPIFVPSHDFHGHQHGWRSPHPPAKPPFHHHGHPGRGHGRH